MPSTKRTTVVVVVACVVLALGAVSGIVYWLVTWHAETSQEVQPHLQRLVDQLNAGGARALYLSATPDLHEQMSEEDFVAYIAQRRQALGLALEVGDIGALHKQTINGTTRYDVGVEVRFERATVDAAFAFILDGDALRLISLRLPLPEGTAPDAAPPAAAPPAAAPPAAAPPAAAPPAAAP